MAEEAQHRHHAVDGVEQRLRRHDVARRKSLAQRQKIEQQFDQRRRIARHMPAVGQDLAAQFVRQPSCRVLDLIGLVGKAERSVSQRDQNLEPRHAVGGLAHG
jgi:hypothetical protein